VKSVLVIPSELGVGSLQRRVLEGLGLLDALRFERDDVSH